jgi:inward rectifier potassium channel
MIAASYLAANALFALGYLWTGGVANMAPGSFKDAFFFSVQTMGTIGYGAVFPRSDAANGLVVGESLTGLLLTALATGLVFAKFSRSTARFVFTRQAVIGPLSGIATLSFRLGNARSNQIVNAEIRVVLIRTERSAGGKPFYRMLDLALTRERALTLSRSWTVLHPIDERSPLRGETAASLAEKEAELLVMVVGLDDTFMQQVHASHRYFARQILWNHRHADVLSETDTGDLVLDLRKFHDVAPVLTGDD